LRLRAGWSEGLGCGPGHRSRRGSTQRSGLPVAWCVQGAGISQVVAVLVVRAVAATTMGDPVPLARPVVVPVVTVNTPDPPDGDAGDVHLVGRQRRRVQVEEVRRQVGDDDLHRPALIVPAYRLDTVLRATAPQHMQQDAQICYPLQSSRRSVKSRRTHGFSSFSAGCTGP
jgi:hypothetical protein